MSVEPERFFPAVYALVRRIPPGRVVSYGQLAQLLGVRHGARAVGWALRALHGAAAGSVPWHRVLGAGGRISLPAPLGGREQRRRLRAEGVRFQGGRVDMARHGLLGVVRAPRQSRLTRGSRSISRAR